jgi:septation ring formation regulator EzrA
MIIDLTLKDQILLVGQIVAMVWFLATAKTELRELRKLVEKIEKRMEKDVVFYPILDEKLKRIWQRIEQIDKRIKEHVGEE